MGDRNDPPVILPAFLGMTPTGVAETDLWVRQNEGTDLICPILAPNMEGFTTDTETIYTLDYEPDSP